MGEHLTSMSVLFIDESIVMSTIKFMLNQLYIGAYIHIYLCKALPLISSKLVVIFVLVSHYIVYFHLNWL